MFFYRIPTIFISILLCFVTENINPVMAQQELCRDVGEIPPSETSRTLELPQFGINILIPENYRALVHNDGSVQILDPGSFALMSCVARGGEATFARGTSSFTIRLVKNISNLPLLSLAQQERIYNGDYYYYDLSGTKVIITESRSGYSVGAWFIPPKIDDVIVMEVKCDCELSRDDIVMNLDRTQLR